MKMNFYFYIEILIFSWMQISFDLIKGSKFSNGASNLNEESRSSIKDEQLYALPDKVNYETAMNLCKSLRMSLVKILDESSNQLVFRFGKLKDLVPYWIDANDIENEGEWVYSDESKIVYSNWYQGEPNNYKNEDCVIGFHTFYQGYWNDIDCHDKNSVICVKDIEIPRAPSNILILDKSSTSIKLRWSPSKKNYHYGTPEGYQVTMNGRDRIRKTTSNYIVFDNLHQCRPYCFVVVSFNKAGRSADSARICTNTTMEFEKVELSPMKADFSVTRLVSGRYNNVNNCPVIFEVAYSLNNDTNVFLLKSRDQNIQLTHLETNKIYSVKVRPTFDGNKGEFSSARDFYIDKTIPITTKIIIHSYKNDILISWGIDARKSMPSNMFMLKISNTANGCLYLVTLICSTCHYKIDEFIMNKTQKEYLRKINKCLVTKNEIFHKDQAQFFNIIPTNGSAINGSLVIYSFNALGVYEINTKYFHLDFKPPTIRNILISLLVITIPVLLVCWIFYKQYCYSNRCQFESLIQQISSSFQTKPVEVEVTFSNIERTRKTNRSIQTYQNDFDVSRNHKMLIDEYKALCEDATEFEMANNLTNETAKLPENQIKNRFKNILPFDQTRVILKNSQTESDYINASFIPFVDDSQTPEYIACQGPTDETISDFWSMIWDQNISIIVMLTRTYEEDKFKCLQYWPDEINDCVKFGTQSQCEISMKEESENEVFVERKFEAVNTITKEKRIIVHLQMMSWNLSTVPEMEDFKSFIFQFHKLILKASFSPYLIHCSAGVSRTGIFIVLDRIVRKLISGEQNIDVYNEVLELRKYRGHMIHRKTEYIFIHEFLGLFLKDHTKYCENFYLIN